MPDPSPDPATGGTPPPAEPADPADPPAEPATEPEPKPTETVDFWKQQARENEKRAKANADAAKELEQLKASQMSENEKAVADAEARGRQAATTEVGQRLAAAEIRAALTGVLSDPSAVVEDLALDKYLTDEGEVDSEKVEALKKKFEGLAGSGSGSPGRDQRTREQLDTVPLNTNGNNSSLSDMNDWMRRKAGSS